MNLNSGFSLLDLITPAPLIQRTPEGGYQFTLGTKALNIGIEVNPNNLELNGAVGPIYGGVGLDIDYGGLYARAGVTEAAEIGVFAGLGLMAYVDAPINDFYAIGVAGLSDFVVQTGKSGGQDLKTVWSMPNPIGRAAIGLAQQVVGALGGMIASRSAGSSGGEISDASAAPLSALQQYSSVL